MTDEDFRIAQVAAQLTTAWVLANPGRVADNTAAFAQVYRHFVAALQEDWTFRSQPPESWGHAGPSVIGS